MTNEHQNTAEEEAEASASSSDRRVWARRNGAAQGTAHLSLKVFRILYDAGQPLNRDEIADRLLAILDPYERGYLEAWYLRHRERHRRAKGGASLGSESRSEADIRRAVSAWLVSVFLQRRSKGQSLTCHGDDRYSPGPRPPLMVTLDGKRIAFTPEARRDVDQAEHDAGRAHLAVMEWNTLVASPDCRTLEARAQLLMVLARRLCLGSAAKGPFDERLLAPRLARLLQLADTPGVKRVILERALVDLVEVLGLRV